MVRHPVRSFDAFVAGAFCFVAGVAVDRAFAAPAWTRLEVVGLAGAAALLLVAVGRLRALYRAAASSGSAAEAAA